MLTDSLDFVTLMDSLDSEDFVTLSEDSELLVTDSDEIDETDESEDSLDSEE